MREYLSGDRGIDYPFFPQKEMVGLRGKMGKKKGGRGRKKKEGRRKEGGRRKEEEGERRRRKEEEPAGVYSGPAAPGRLARQA
ncbi:unnamed protein product [Urochloa humidicola]